MKETVLIVGGAGFVGSNLAILLKKDYPGIHIIAFDNLRRNGSQLNVPRLKAAGIAFCHGDIRTPSDLEDVGAFDLLIDCAAEPSVLAGYGTSPVYVTQTNLSGSLNCFEMARRYHADVIFLSTSRVYPIKPLRQLKYRETATRFELDGAAKLPGITPNGICETFPLDGVRSIYGSAKLAAELILIEYSDAYNINAIINRCGILTGPWQMGRVDQGVAALWVARHLFGGHLTYNGYGGSGKQVRDLLHVQDLYALLNLQLNEAAKYSGQVFNVGGGKQNTLSLLELTGLCQHFTGRQIAISQNPETHSVDIPWYISDCSKIESFTQWRPKRSVDKIIEEIATWMIENKEQLQPIFCEN